MRRLLVHLMIVLLAGACSIGEALADYGDPVELAPADLVGAWHGGTQRLITFAEGGSFDAKNLPYAAFEGLLPAGFDRTRPVDGSGTWQLDGAGVELTFLRLGGDEVNAGGPDLNALRQDGVVYLVFFYVDQGNSWTAYRKCTDATAPCP